MPRLEAPSISTTSMATPSAMRTHEGHWSHGSGVGPLTQLSPLARRRATVVLPVPRGPLNKYAWAMRFSLSALLSVRTTCCCPMTSEKRRGRHFRYNETYATAHTSRCVVSFFRQPDNGLLHPRRPPPAPAPAANKKAGGKPHRLKNEPCTRRRLASPGVTRAVSSDRAPSRHTDAFAYRCFLPDLTGFTKVRCARPDRQRHLLGADPTETKPRAGIRP